MKPACMTDAEYAGWLVLQERITAAADRAGSPCEDCPASFANEMRAIEACDGEPGYVPGDDMFRPNTRPEASRRATEARREQSRRRAEEAARLYRSGLTQTEVAERLGLHLETVQRYLHKAGLKVRLSLAERQERATYHRELAQGLAATGTPLDKIAEELNVHRDTARKYLRDAA